MGLKKIEKSTDAGFSKNKISKNIFQKSVVKQRIILYTVQACVEGACCALFQEALENVEIYRFSEICTQR